MELILRGYFYIVNPTIQMNSLVFAFILHSREPRFARHPLGIVKNSIYIIILSVCLCVPTSGSLALLGSLSAPKDDLYSEKTHFSALRAGGACEAGFFFHGSISFVKTVPTRYHTSMGRVGKCVLLLRYLPRQGDRQGE